MENSSFMNKYVGSGRYRTLILSIVLFLFLILLLLAFTFVTSSRLERNTALINEANFVSKSAQAVIKDLFDLDNSIGENIRSKHMTRVHDRLEDNSKRLTESLAIIGAGGRVTTEEGTVINLPKLVDAEALEDLASAQSEWAKLQPKVNTYLENARDIHIDSSKDLSQAVDQAKTSSLLIDDSLTALSNDVFKVAEREANLIRIIQLIGVALIFAYFLVFIFFFIRRLRASDNEAVEARKETEEIMQTVNTGLFLLDRDLNIGNQHSKALEGIMGTDRLAGQNLTSVLRSRISDTDLDTTKQFIEQLYNPRVKSKLVNDLNPLNKVMLHNDDGNTSVERYLDFNFSRVYEGKSIERILVNVSDVSEAVRLEKRLEKEREQNDLQIEMLTTILNVSPKLINDFITNTTQRIAKINNVLKNPGTSQFELQGKLRSIYREMHSLKGEASALNLHSFSVIANDAEEKLNALQNQGKLSGNDFLPLTVELDNLLNLTNTISALGERINQATHGAIKLDSNEGESVVDQINKAHATDISQKHDVVTQASGDITNNLANTVIQPDISGSHEELMPDSNGSVAQDLTKYYQDFAQQIASRQQKEVQLFTSGMDIQISAELATTVKELSIQLLRNAIVHGIELPSTRQNHGKPATGEVHIRQVLQDGYLHLEVEDDGSGIDYDGIQRRLINLGHSQDDVDQMTKGKLLNALFSSGFSTKEVADEDAGRGVGLDIIRDRVKSLDGKIKVKSEFGQMTRFTLLFPV